MPDQELLDDFLEALERAASPVKNLVLREALGWDETQYEAVKAELVARRIVVRGRGRSDTVSLVGAEPAAKPATPSRNGKAAAAEPKDKSLESWIWDAACSIRGAKDAAKYKDYILPLIFTKRLCDVFDDELNRIAEQVGSRAKAFQLVHGVAAFGEALGEGYQSSKLLCRCESRVMPSFLIAASYLSRMAE
jgi:type I restriction enzyme M protein